MLPLQKDTIAMDHIEIWIEQLLINAGATEAAAGYLRVLVFCALVIPFAALAFWVCRKIITNYIYRFLIKTPVTWDDALAEHGVFNHVAHIVPAIIVKILAPTIFRDFENMLPLIIKLTDIYLMIVAATIVFAFLKAAEVGLSKHDTFKDKPL